MASRIITSSPEPKSFLSFSKNLRNVQNYFLFSDKSQTLNLFLAKTYFFKLDRHTNLSALFSTAQSQARVCRFAFPQQEVRGDAGNTNSDETLISYLKL